MSTGFFDRAADKRPTTPFGPATKLRAWAAVPAAWSGAVMGFLFLAQLLSAPFSMAAPMAGGPHDRTSDPAFAASQLQGTCHGCHIPHSSQEMVLWRPDLSPDATTVLDLCMWCHDGSPPPWASDARDESEAVNSLHDFSGAAAGADGTCNTCHHLHLPDETTASYAGSQSGDYFNNSTLWTRDVSGILSDLYQKRDLATDSDPSGGPNYLVGKTIFCYDCHGGDARTNGPDDADFPNPPQDIAFGGDRDVADGTVGYYELPTGEEPDSTTPAPTLLSILSNPDDPDTVPGGHYVRSPMDTGAIPVTDNYEVRDSEGILLYKISVGDKMPCELCHDPHLKESSLSSSPPDEVFFRRDIRAGEEVVVDRSSESYFSERLEASSLTRNGAGGTGDGRKMCIYCHGTSDWDETQNPGPTGGIAPLVMNWVDRTTLFGIQIRTATTPGGSLAFPPPDYSYHAKDDTQPACTRCHGHNNARITVCYGCHGGGDSGNENYWPDGSPSPPAFPDKTGAHDAHVSIIEARNTFAGQTPVERQNTACDWCHPDPGGLNIDGAGHTRNTVGSAAATADLNQDSLNTGTYFKNIVPLMGTYDVAGPAGTATYATATSQCSNLYCHGDYLGGSNASPTWGSTASGGCGTCHPDGSQHSSGSHAKHVGTAAGEYGARIVCNDCHQDVSGAGAGVHWDMRADTAIDSIYGSAAAYSPGSEGGTAAVGDTYGSCSALDCHGAAMPSGAAGADTTPVWGDTATGQCGDCHRADSSPGIASGSHTVHLDSGSGVYAATIRYDCSRCHNLVDTNDNGTAGVDSVNLHADMATDIDFDSLNADARTYQETGTGQCASLYCHGNFTGGNANNVATWGSPASGNCGTCHGSDAAATPTSGSHPSHLDSVPDGPDAECGDCHGTGADTGVHPGHGDGALSIVPSLGYASTTSTCSGTNLGLGCHNSYDSPAWGSTPDCSDCHQGDAPPDDGDGDPFSALHYVDPAYTTVQAHDQDLWAGTMGGQSGCETCHTSGPSDLHYDGVVQFSADTINFASSVNFADSAVPTCAPDGGRYIECHAD